MAAAFYNQLAGGGAISAGMQPSKCVHSEVVAVMKEVGIDLSNAKPQLLTHGLVEDADLLITMGCGEACPYLPGTRREDWPVPDPKDKPLTQVRKIRDEIKTRVQALVRVEDHPAKFEVQP